MDTLKEIVDNLQNVLSTAKEIRQEDGELLILARHNSRSLAILRQGVCATCADRLIPEDSVAVLLDGELPMVYICGTCFEKGRD